MAELGGYASAGRPTDLDGLETQSALDAAADFFNDFADGYAHGYFDERAACDLAGEGEHLGSLACPGSQFSKTHPPVAYDPGHKGVCFDVVDQRGLVPQALVDRIRRTKMRHPPHAHDTGKKRGLLTADKGAGAGDNFQLKREIAAKDIFADKTAPATFLNRLCHPRDRQRILGTDIEVTLAGAHNPGSDGKTFDDAIRARFHQHAVHERTGVAFVAVADDVFGVAVAVVHGGPLQMRRITRSAPAAQAALANLIDNRLAVEFFYAFGKRLKAVFAYVLIEIDRVDCTAVLGGDILLLA